MELLLRIIFAIGLCYGTIALICLFLKKTKTNVLKRASDSCSQFLKMAITILLGVLFILNCIDAISTWYAITYIGAYEANGMMAWLIQRGWVWFFLFKIAMISLVVAELYFLYVKGLDIFSPKKKQKPTYLIESTANVCIFVGLYLWVCVHNFSVILSKQ